MRVLVTGSNGCVGGAVQELCRDESNWVFSGRKDCDLTDRQQTIKFFQSIQPDYVVHLASYVPGFYNVNSVASFSDNVRINENVLEATHLAGVDRGMFCLSVHMFPEVPSRFPMDESMMFEGAINGPLAGYAYSKRMLELQCQNYNHQYGRKYFGIIPCNVYGPHDNLKSGRLIPSLICRFKEAIEADSDVVINGTGEPLRQFIYSIDLAKVIKHLINTYDGVDSIVCCGDTEVRIAELAGLIGEVMNFSSRIKFDSSRPDGNLKRTVDNSYLKTLLPSTFSFTSLKVGLKETIDHMGII